MAYSTNSSNRTWTLPPGWSGVNAVTLYDITPTGTQFAGYLPVSNNTVTLAMTAGRAVKITPKDNASTAGAPLGQTIWLRAPANNYVVAWANQTGAPLKANSTAVGNWEKLQWIDLGGGRMYLKAASNGNYLIARPDDPESPVRATSHHQGSPVQFQWGPAS